MRLFGGNNQSLACACAKLETPAQRSPVRAKIMFAFFIFEGDKYADLLVFKQSPRLVSFAYYFLGVFGLFPSYLISEERSIGGWFKK